MPNLTPLNRFFRGKYRAAFPDRKDNKAQEWIARISSTATDKVSVYTVRKWCGGAKIPERILLRLANRLSVTRETIRGLQNVHSART